MAEAEARYAVGQWVEFVPPAPTAQGETGETEGVTPASPADEPTVVGGDGVIVAVHPAPDGSGGFVYDIALPGLSSEEVWPLVACAEAEILGLHPGHAAF